MESDVLLKYDQRVPRYTSYPTAVQFTDDVGPDQHTRWLGEVGREEPVSLYVHVPFCEVLCWYCGCNTQ
ncbi:MAG: coproporphyrinogen III oxidase, partial [Rhodospirillaceae bacterium]|nr:coproporphyrinogen III oxidase [Rhodospirillaceae bacterium]